MKGLTKRQEEVLDFIRNYISGHHFPPTIREISANFEISVKGAHDHVKALEKKEFLRCNNNQSRAIEVLLPEEDDSEGTISVSILGTVAAGAPIFAEENYEGVIKVAEDLLRNGNYFALNIRGDSMRDAGIMSGDTAIIKKQEHANNGEIIVALMDDSVTLKRFFHEKHRIRLKAENPAYPPIYTQEIKILGKLAHIIRSYE